MHTHIHENDENSRSKQETAICRALKSKVIDETFRPVVLSTSRAPGPLKSGCLFVILQLGLDVSPPARLIGHSGSRTNRFHHNNKMCDNRWNQIYFSMPATPQTWSRNRTQLHKLPTHAALQRPGLFLFYFLSSIDYKIFIIYYHLFCYFFKVVRVYVPPDFCCCCCFDLSTTRKRRVEHAQWETRSAIGWHVFSVCVPQNFAADAFSSFSV